MIFKFKKYSIILSADIQIREKKWSNTLENSPAVPQSLNSYHMITILHQGIYKGTESICSQKNLYANVHSSIMHKSQKAETIQMAVNWRMDKQHVIYPYNRVLFSYNKE